MVVVGVRLSRGIRSLDANGSTAPSIVSACKVSRTAQRHADVPHCVVPVFQSEHRHRSTKTRLTRTSLHLLYFSNNLHLDLP